MSDGSGAGLNSRPKSLSTPPTVILNRSRFLRKIVVQGGRRRRRVSGLVETHAGQAERWKREREGVGRERGRRRRRRRRERWREQYLKYHPTSGVAHEFGGVGAVELGEAALARLNAPEGDEGMALWW